MLEFVATPINTFFNWCLTKLNVNVEHKRQQTVKLKRLLYNLLELKNWVGKEVFLDQQINRLISIYADEIGQQMPEGGAYVKEKQSWILQKIKKSFLSVDKFTAAAENIEITLKELSEINPLFAFQLSGIYNITEKMEMIKAYFYEASSEVENEDQDNDAVFNDFLRPQIINDVFIQLQQDILEVAKMIDTKTYNKVVNINQQTNQPVDENEFKQFVAPLIAKIIKSATSQDRAH